MFQGFDVFCLKIDLVVGLGIDSFYYFRALGIPAYSVLLSYKVINEN